MSVRLLVVDDNADYRVLVRFALKGSEIEVVGESASIAGGLLAAAELQPDLIMLDVVMQDDDALASLQPLREAAPTAAVVVVAAYAEHELWGMSPHAEGVAYLSKGTPPQKLCEQLMRVATSAHAVNDVISIERRRFASEVQSAGAARRFAAGVLASWGCEDIEDSVLLLVSELVTNAVIHAHSNVEVILRLRPERVRVEVIDDAAAYVQRRVAANEDQSGRGMALTEALAEAWGVDTLVAGKSVWFEVARGDCGVKAS